MSWKCCCKEENNSDDDKVCKKCRRKKPEYLGIELNFDSTAKMPEDQKAVWLMMIAHKYLERSDHWVEEFLEFRNNPPDNSEWPMNIRNNVIDYCNKCITYIGKSSNISSKVQFKDSDDVVHSAQSLLSNAYFNLGRIFSLKPDYPKCIKYYQQSYDADPNQVSIYNIAISTIALPAEDGGGFFGKAKRKETATETKKQQEIDLLKKVILFSPFSDLGIETGMMLMGSYDIDENDL